MNNTPAPSIDGRPGVLAPRLWAFPQARAAVLSNGLRLLTYHVPGQYVMAVRLSVPLPLRAEPREREGVGTIMARCLDEGTASHSAEELAELLERTGAGIGAGMAESGLMVDLDVTRRNLSPALGLLAECLCEAQFPEAEVARHVQQRLAEIAQERASASTRAATEFIATFFDPVDRASRPSAGGAETVAAVGSKDARTFFAGVRPDASTLVLAGDLGGLDVAGKVDAALARWSGQAWGAGPPDVPPRHEPPAKLAANRMVFVDRPGSAQTELYIGCPGPDRRDPRGWAPYQVLAFVLGGSPTSRLDAVLREDKGYTYGIRSTFRPRSRGGMFLTSGSVRADATAPALELLLDLLDGARGGFTDTECQAGVDYVGRTAPGRYATAEDIADEAATLAVDELGTGFVTDTLASLARLRPQDLDEAYTAHADAGWTVVLVGDATAYAEQVRRLGRGMLSVVPA